jgi:hypothetical protein
MKGTCMRKPYVALVTATGLLLAVGAPAEAAGRGGVGSAFVPHGLTSTNPGFTNGMKSTEIAPATTSGQTTGYGPSGWTQGQGKAPDPWKGITSSGSPASSPPGLNGTGR